MVYPPTDPLATLLGCVHDAARLVNPVSRTVENPAGAQLLAALRQTQGPSWRCDEMRQAAKNGGSTRALFEVYKRRLAVISSSSRVPQRPSGYRPDSHLLIDLRMLTDEGHLGVSIECEFCEAYHVISRRVMKRENSPKPHPVTTSPEPPPHHPTPEIAAFAELVADRSRPDWAQQPFHVFLTAHREDAYRAHFANDPFALSQAILFTGQRLRISDPAGPSSSILSPWSTNPTHRIGEWPTKLKS